MPEVSILLANFNRAEMLNEALESLLAQTYGNFEIIIADDGSTDNSREIVSNIDDKRIIWLSLAHQGNLSRIRNTGIANARGQWLCFMDSDDHWEPHKLAVQIKKTKLSNSHFSICGWQEFGDSSAKSEYTCLSKDDLFDQAIKGSTKFYPSSTFLFHKDCLQRTSGMDEGIFSSDFHFLLEILYYFKGTIISERLCHIRKHKQNISNQKVQEGVEEAIKSLNFFLEIKAIDKPTYSHLYDRQLYQSGIYYLNSSDRSPARKQFIKLWEKKPNLKLLIRIIQTYL